MTTRLNVALSHKLQETLGQQGVYAYAVLIDGGKIASFETLVDGSSTHPVPVPTTAIDLPTTPGEGTAAPQTIEIAIDALDIPAVRPFWRAVTGYAADPQPPDLPPGALVDPLHRGPVIWFQQMDRPRHEHRNRIHIDVDVPPEHARARIDAALAAGGRLVSAAAAPAFWVLADPEGNEVCVCTWEGRD